jgi:hypothetical protein
MSLSHIVSKKNRHLAFDVAEVIALDYHESLKDLTIYLKGGGKLSIKARKAAQIYAQLTENLPNLIESDDDDSEDSNHEFQVSPL